MRLNTRRLRRMFKPQKIGHTVKGVPQYVGDSIRGLRWMFRVGKRQADRNTITTKDGVPLNTHWDRPLMHGWKDTAGKWKRLQRISQSTFAETRTLRSKKGDFHMNSTERDLAEMGRLGYKVAWIEPKVWNNMDNQAIWDEIAAMGKRHGVTLKGYALPGNWKCLPYMNAAGIPSHRLRRR